MKAHAAAYCQNGTSFEAYLIWWVSCPPTSIRQRSNAQTVASSWKPSIVGTSANAPLATDVLEMAAHLGADAIPT